MEGARTLRNKAYLQYVAMTKDEAQRLRWTFYEAVLLAFEDQSHRPIIYQGHGHFGLKLTGGHGNTL